MQDLASRRIYVGGNSWKYEGWLGQVYRRERYLSRGKFSRKLFESECLQEYAQTFPTVCGDFAFYQFPTPEFWERLFRKTPAGFQFAFKVPEQITCKIFPIHPRYGPQAGKDNESFLDARVFHEMFARPLLPYRDKTALMIFEFGAFNRRGFAELGQFLDRLDPFLAALPPEFRYAVEIRNPEFLEKDYFSCLRSHGVAHVYNAWSKMPELQSQIAIPDSATGRFPGLPGAAAPGPRLRGRGEDVRALYGGARPESRSPGVDARADPPRAGGKADAVPLREQPPRGKCARHDTFVRSTMTRGAPLPAS